eukprot:4840515-Pyramimonas_sp.AAC.1
MLGASRVWVRLAYMGSACPTAHHAARDQQGVGGRSAGGRGGNGSSRAHPGMTTSTRARISVATRFRKSASQRARRRGET